MLQERRQDWQSRFGQHLHLTCGELTGDTAEVDLDAIEAADIICTTPEKFGALLLMMQIVLTCSCADPDISTCSELERLLQMLSPESGQTRAACASYQR